MRLASVRASVVVVAVCALTLAHARQLKVVTYNLANYNDHGHWPARLNLIADALVAEDAEIILMQETRFDPEQTESRATYQDMAQQILQELNKRGKYTGAHLVTQPTMYYSHHPDDISNREYVNPISADPQGTGRYWEGSSIISKKRILETGTSFMSLTTSCRDPNLRATQFISIHLGDDAAAPFFHEIPESEKMYLFNTHFGLRDPCLSDNVAETLEYMRPRSQKAMALLAGDLNAFPNNSLIDPLRQQGLVDEWAALHPDDDGFTCCTPAGHTQKQDRRIDYFWTNKLLSQYATDIKIIGQQYSTTLGSDHYGISIVFDFD